MPDPTTVYDDGVLTITRSSRPRGYVLIGELDAATYDGLARALDALDGAGDVHLDLSGLEFCDAPGFGTMVGLAERLAPGHRVVLDGVPPALCRLAAIVGWDALPNLTVRGRDARCRTASASSPALAM